MDTETDTRRGKMIQRDTGRRWPYTSQGENARTDLSFPHSPQEVARGAGGEVAGARKEPRTKAGNIVCQKINIFS